MSVSYTHLQQHQDGDNRRCFKIEAKVAGGIAKRSGKKARGDHGRKAVKVSSAGSHRNEREHIQTAMNNRGPATLKEGPSSPQHHWRCQGELSPPQSPASQDVLQGMAGQKIGDHDGEQRKRQHDPYLQASRHAGQFGIGRVYCDGSRLERHAADGTRTGSIAYDLRMHGAGVLGPVSYTHLDVYKRQAQ